MKPVDVVAAVTCPLYAVAEHLRRKDDEAKADVYYGASGAAAQGDAKSAEAAKPVDVSSGAIVALLVAAVLIFFLWIVPLVSAVKCGSGATTLGLNGVAWGLIIYFFPPFGVIYLLAGGSCDPSADPPWQ